MLRWESQRAAAPDASSWVASACLSEPQADIPLPPDKPSESTSPGARRGDRGPHGRRAALFGFSCRRGARGRRARGRAHDGRPERGERHGSQTGAPGCGGPAGRWKPWGRGGRHAAAGASLQGGEGLAGGGVVGVDLYGPLVGVAGALRVALAAAALVGLAEPVVGLGAGRRGEESAVLGALDRL